MVGRELKHKLITPCFGGQRNCWSKSPLLSSMFSNAMRNYMFANSIAVYTQTCFLHRISFCLVCEGRRRHFGQAQPIVRWMDGWMVGWLDDVMMNVCSNLGRVACVWQQLDHALRNISFFVSDYL